MGLWILEQCRKEWQRNGVEFDYDVLLREVEAIEDYPALIFPDDQRFLNPPGRLAALGSSPAETGQASLSEPALHRKNGFGLTRVSLCVAARNNRVRDESEDKRGANYWRRQPKRLSEPGDRERDRVAGFGGPG